MFSRSLSHRSLASRSAVRTRATAEEFRHSQSYLMFELLPEYSFITLFDLESAYDACHSIPEAEIRHECYAAFGINGFMMDRYYLKISNMERTYYDDGFGQHTPDNTHPDQTL